MWLSSEAVQRLVAQILAQILRFSQPQFVYHVDLVNQTIRHLKKEEDPEV